MKNFHEDYHSNSYILLPSLHNSLTCNRGKRLSVTQLSNAGEKKVLTSRVVTGSLTFSKAMDDETSVATGELTSQE